MSPVRLAALLLALALPAGAFAAPLAAGSPAPVGLSLEDQHGKTVTLASSARLLIFTADRAGSDLVNEVLGAEKSNPLERLHATYLADISARPALVTRMFALPAMRALPFPIGLARDAGVLADLPRQKGAVTVLRLTDGQVTGVDFAADPARLRKLLGL